VQDALGHLSRVQVESTTAWSRSPARSRPGDAERAAALRGRVEGVAAVVDQLRFPTDERIADALATPTY
jgi:hypothetical protein